MNFHRRPYITAQYASDNFLNDRCDEIFSLLSFSFFLSIFLLCVFFNFSVNSAFQWVFFQSMRLHLVGIFGFHFDDYVFLQMVLRSMLSYIFDVRIQT